MERTVPWRHPKTVALTDAWIAAYEQRRQPPARAIAPGSHEHEAPPEPTTIQQKALASLASSRDGAYPGDTWEDRSMISSGRYFSERAQPAPWVGNSLAS